MKTMMTALAASTALVVPAIAPASASATTVHLHTQIAQYWGNPTFLAYYLTDSHGRYVRTLWLASGTSRYWPHLENWYRDTGGARSQIAGLSGASVGPGRTLNVSVDVKQSLIDAGYQIHIDAAAERMPDSPNEVVIPLKSSDSGKTVRGRGYVQSFSFSL